YTQLLQERIPRALPPADRLAALGPGERLVFEPYTKQAHAETFAWIARHGIFADGGLDHRGYKDSVNIAVRGGVGSSTPDIGRAYAARCGLARSELRDRFTRATRWNRASTTAV